MRIWETASRAFAEKSFDRLTNIPTPKWARYPTSRREKRALSRIERRKPVRGRPKGVAARVVTSIREKVIATVEMTARVRAYKEKVDARRRW